MEFFIGLSYYLYYFTSGCTLKSCSHKSFQNVLWSHNSGHVVHLLKFPHYLYLGPIVHLDVVDQMFKCTRNYFLLGALITSHLFLVKHVSYVFFIYLYLMCSHLHLIKSSLYPLPLCHFGLLLLGHTFYSACHKNTIACWFDLE